MILNCSHAPEAVIGLRQMIWATEPIRLDFPTVHYYLLPEHPVPLVVNPRLKLVVEWNSIPPGWAESWNLSRILNGALT